MARALAWRPGSQVRCWRRGGHPRPPGPSARGVRGRAAPRLRARASAVASGAPLRAASSHPSEQTFAHTHRTQTASLPYASAHASSGGLIG